MIDRILMLLQQNKLTAKQLTTELGIAPSSVSEWKKGKMKPTLEILIRISLIFNITLDWLITGEGEMHKKKSLAFDIKSKESELLQYYRKLENDQQTEILTRTKVYAELQQKAADRQQKKAENKNNLHNKSKQRAAPIFLNKDAIEAVEFADEIVKFPLMPELKEMKVFSLPASAGLGNYLENESPFDMITYEAAKIPARADFGIRISGDSMEPLIHDGDIVWVKEQNALDNNEIGIFIVENEAYCKRLELNHRNKTARLVSLNEKYVAIPIKKNQVIKTVGKVLL